MYVESNRLQRNGNTYRTVTVRESFRLNGKAMRRTVANLTDLPQYAIDAVQQALRLGQTPTPAGLAQVHKNPDRAKRDCATRRSLIQKTTEALDKLVRSRRIKPDKVAAHVGVVLTKYHTVSSDSRGFAVRPSTWITPKSPTPSVGRTSSSSRFWIC